MIIKQVVVNGETLHVNISKEEALKAIQKNEPLIFTDEQEKIELYELVDALNNEKAGKENKQEQAKKESKTAKLLKLIHFLDEDSIHELMTKILNEEDIVKDLNIMAIVPFLSDEDTEALFFKAIESNQYNFDPIAITPFLSNKCLTKVVDLYIEGKFPDLNIDGLYPFLNNEDIKRLFNFVISNDEA